MNISLINKSTKWCDGQLILMVEDVEPLANKLNGLVIQTQNHNAYSIHGCGFQSLITSLVKLVDSLIGQEYVLIKPIKTLLNLRD
jgi:hypothetical protein